MNSGIDTAENEPQTGCKLSLGETLSIKIGPFIHSFIHSFIHVQSVENVGTRKKRKENMRKAIDVETKKRKKH